MLSRCRIIQWFTRTQYFIDYFQHKIVLCWSYVHSKYTLKNSSKDWDRLK